MLKPRSNEHKTKLWSSQNMWNNVCSAVVVSQAFLLILCCHCWCDFFYPVDVDVVMLLMICYYSCCWRWCCDVVDDLLSFLLLALMLMLGMLLILCTQSYCCSSYPVDVDVVWLRDVESTCWGYLRALVTMKHFLKQFLSFAIIRLSIIRLLFYNLALD